MPPLCGIYSIKNEVNGNLYVGSSNDILKRWRNHRYQLNHQRHPNSHLQGAWNKYGKESFSFNVLQLVDQDSLPKVEQEYLEKLHPKYNQSLYTESPMRGRKHSEELKEKMKEISRRLMTPEKNKIMLSARYANHVYKQKEYVPKEIRLAHLSEASKRRWSNPEYKSKMCIVRKNQITDKIRKNLSSKVKEKWKDEDFRNRSINSRQKVAAEGRGKATFTVDDVREIRKQHWEDGLSARAISEIRNVSYHTIRSLLYDNWKWVK